MKAANRGANPFDGESGRSRIEREASEWMVLREDRGLAQSELATFDAWLAADPRHEPAISEMTTTWKALDQLRFYPRPADEFVDADFFKERGRIRPKIPILYFAAALAATLVLYFHSWIGKRLVHRMTLIAALAALHPGARAAQESSGELTLSIDASHPGQAIPADFVGASISNWNISGDQRYDRPFVPGNRELVNVFREVGIRHLRVIMGPAKKADPDPTDTQIDSFFDFARAVGVTGVIWSFHVYNEDDTTGTNWQRNLPTARHIWATPADKALVESFAFGNESDWLHTINGADPSITGYRAPIGHGFVDQWEKLRDAVAVIVPGARFSGPDTGSEYPDADSINTSIRGVPFTLQFVLDEGSRIWEATQHFYGGPNGALNAEQMAQRCLSPEWLSGKYQPIYDHALTGEARWPHSSGGQPLPYRMTESSPFSGGRNRAAQIFATGLWGVDYFHWWALHGCFGVDPFIRTAQTNAAVYYDGTDYRAEPYAYGMKAFALGSDGQVIPSDKCVLSLEPSDLNLTAYAVVNPHHLYVTLINKTCTSAPKGPIRVLATVRAPKGFSVSSARSVVLAAGSGSYGDATVYGATLGHSVIPNDGSSWAGTWTPLNVTQGGITLEVDAATAVVIDLYQK